jgi:hypothetical protein
MQAAIDRVFRSLSFKVPACFDGEARPDATRNDAEALAERLLENFKGQLVHNAGRHH